MPLTLTLYRGATTGLSPLTSSWLGRRVARGKEEPARLGERYGIAGQARPAGSLIWVHAASMGETMSALALIEALAARATVLLTTGTLTSAALAVQRAHAIHQFVPLDVPAYATRFLNYWHPDAAIFLESEIWPNLLTALDSRTIPRFLLNARLSARSAARWQRVPALRDALFGGFTLIAAQSEHDAAAFRSLGLGDIESWGNLKFSAPDLPDDASARAALNAACPGPWLLAASTHPGEETPVIHAHRGLRRLHPTLTTVIVPRHPERADAVARLAGNLKLARRSRGERPAPGGIYLADTFGELGIFYRLCTIAFIGGSLVPVGGHNVIEAAQLGCAIVVGPHTENHFEATAILRAVGAVVDVADFMQFEGAIARLMCSPDRIAEMGAASRGVCQGFADLPRRLAQRVFEAIAG